MSSPHPLSSQLQFELEQIFAACGLAATQFSMVETLCAFLDLLQRWNEKMDLVAPAPATVLMQRHILDSSCAWALLQSLKLPAEGAYLDVGSGAGLPGVVFSILEPGRKVILCEPRDKRAAFLKEAKRSLGLDGIDVVQCRLEQLQLDERLALIITRATALREAFLSFAAQWLLPGGVAAEMRGEEISKAIEEASSLQGTLISLPDLHYPVPGAASRHKIVAWRCGT